MTGSTAARHLAADRAGHSPQLAGDPDAELVPMVVAAIPLVDLDAAGLDPSERFEFGDNRARSVAVKRIAVQRLGVEDKLAAYGRGRRGGDRDLAAELVGRPRFAFADALDLRRMQRIDLEPAPAVVLQADPQRQAEQVGKPAVNAGLPAIVRPMSRIPRPKRVRSNLSSRRARSN